MSKCRVAIAAQALGRATHQLSCTSTGNCPAEIIANVLALLFFGSTEAVRGQLHMKGWRAEYSSQIARKTNLPIVLKFILLGAFLLNFKLLIWTVIAMLGMMMPLSAQEPGGMVSRHPLPTRERRTAGPVSGAKEWTARSYVSTSKRSAARARLTTDGSSSGMPGILPSKLVRRI